MSWKKLLEAAKESLNDHMRLRNEYLTAENRILRHQINGRVQLTDNERKELAEIGVKLGKKALTEIATVAQPETILAWNRKFANQPTGAPKRPKSVGRPRVDQEIEDWVVRMARENRSWGYDRIQGSLRHLGYKISDQTVGNILKRHGIPPAPERKKTVTWREFVRIHLDVLGSTGFFDSEVWSWLGRIISVVLSFIHFSRYQVQSMRISLDRQLRNIQVRVQRSLHFSRHLLRCGSLVAPRLQQVGVRDTVSGPTGSEVLFVEARFFRSQHMTRMVILSSARHRRVRDGPRRQQPQHDRPWLDSYREAA